MKDISAAARDRARAHLNTDLAGLAGRRRRDRIDIDETATRIGAMAIYLREKCGQSKAKTAAIAGISPGHLTAWMTASRTAGMDIGGEVGDRVPWLDGDDLTGFVAHHGGIARIVASTHPCDVLLASALSPAQFLFAGAVCLPHVAIGCASGAVVACDEVSVGNPLSTTGINTAIVLASLGVDDATATQIVAAPFSDTTFDDHRAVTTHITETPRWPRFDVDDDLIAHRGGFVIEISADGYTAAGDPVWRSPLRVWLDWLDSDGLPSWVQGPRTARMYFDPTAARADGYTPIDLGSTRSTDGYRVIISQGALHLWADMLTPTAPGHRYPRELHELLATLGFYPTDTTSARTAFMAWHAAMGPVTPPFVDLPPQTPTP